MAVSRKHKRIEIIVGAIIIFVVAIAYLAVLDVYDNEAAKRSVAVVIEDSEQPDRLDILARIQSVDTNKGEMIVRLEFEAQGELAEDDISIIPSVDILLFTPGTTTKQEHKLEAGRLMGAKEIVIPLEGLASDYPFDEHEAQLAIIAFGKPPAPAPSAPASGGSESDSESDDTDEDSGGDSAGPSPAASSNPATDEDLTELPINVALYAALPSVDLAVQLGEDSGSASEGIADATINVKRAITVFGFVIFVMIAFWVIAIAILFQAITIASRGREPEPDTMGYMAALLFAFPVMRDALPGTPPVGAFSDYVSFFWAEAIVAISLFIVLTVWIRRPTGHPRWWRPEPEPDYDDELPPEIAPSAGPVPGGYYAEVAPAGQAYEPNAASVSQEPVTAAPAESEPPPPEPPPSSNPGH